MGHNQVTNSELVAFADDVVMVTSAEDADTAVAATKGLVDLMKQELARVGLTMSEGKLKFMMKSFEERSTINWGGQERNLESQMKILGVVFDKDGKFSGQISELETKAMNLTREYHSLVYSSLCFDLRKMLACTIIMPKLLYGANAWLDKTNRHDRNTLERVTRIIGKIITGAPSQAGKAAAAVMSKMLPFHLLAKGKALLQKELSALNVRMEATVVNWGHPSSWRVRDFGTTIETNEQAKEVGADIYLYTDGSRFADEDGVHVGSAVIELIDLLDGDVSLQTVSSCKLGDQSTVFEAEMVAIKEAAKHAASYQPGTKVAIMTDSLSALMAIKNPTPGSKLTIYCQVMIDEARAKGISLSLHHVRAHVGILGNENADAVAKLSATAGSSLNVPVSRSTLKRKIRDRLYEEYNSWYDRCSGRTVKLFFDGPFDPQLKRAKIDYETAAFYSGHAWNLESMRFGYEGAQQRCRCGELQTTVHALTECSLYMAENLQVAGASGIPIEEFIRPWTELSKHPRIHDYVYARARGLNERLKIDNLPHCEIESLTNALRRLNLREDADLDEPLRDESEEWPLYSDDFLSAFDVKVLWHLDVEWAKWW